MIASVITWIVAKSAIGSAAIEGAKLIPWKWIGVGLSVIAVVSVIGFGYLHVRNLQADLVNTATQLAEQRLKAGLEKARADAISKAHDLQVDQMQKLEDERSRIEQEAAALRTEIQNLNLEDISHEDQAKADAAIARLNARNAELNRLQSHESGNRNVRAGKAADGKAGKARTGGFVKRAIQALRKDGVHHAD